MKYKNFVLEVIFSSIKIVGIDFVSSIILLHLITVSSMAPAKYLPFAQLNVAQSQI